MPIIGIGVDLVKNARIHKILTSNYAERFLHKVLHTSELEEINSRTDIASKTNYLASRWCYKEAAVKASGRRELIFPKMYLKKS
jgi:holo-[acyl-carrier-protein] synthase